MTSPGGRDLGGAFRGSEPDRQALNAGYEIGYEMRAPSGAPSSFLASLQELRGSPDWTRTSNPPVNSRMLYQLSYRGRQPRDCSRGLPRRLRGRNGGPIGESGRMRRFAVVGVAVSIGVLAFAPSGLAASARVAALQVGLRAHGFDPGPVDGVRGPADDARAARLPAQARDSRDRARRPRDEARARGVAAARCSASASSGSARSGGTSRCSSSGSGTTGSARARSTAASRARTGVALRRYQMRRGLAADGIAGPRTYRSLAGHSATAPIVVARRRAGRELLLDRRALPREPMAARAPEPALAHRL